MTKQCRKRLAIRFLFIFILLLAGCQSTSLSETAQADPSEMGEETAFISSESEAELSSQLPEQSPAAVEAEYTVLPALIESENLLVYTYRDMALQPVDFHFQKPEDYGCFGYSDDYVIRVFKCSDGTMVYGYQAYGSRDRKNMIYNFASDSYVELGKGEYPYILDNGKIALVTPNSVTLFESDGQKSEIQLQFDWGRVLTYEDDALIKTLYASYDYDTFPEHVPIGLTYDAETRQYILLHGPSLYMEHPTFHAPDEYRSVSISLFDEYGAHDRTFPVDGLFVSQLSKGYTLPPANVYMRPNGRIVFYFYPYTGIIDLQSGAWTDDISASLEQEPVLVENMRKYDLYFYFAQPECPVQVEYHPDKTEVLTQNGENVLLQLDAGYTLAFYTFNSDGSCNLIFEYR